MDKLLKTYLIGRGFELKSVTFQYKVRLRCDFLVAIVYAIVSSILIVVQEADLIVLGLNILCSFRALISNTINASEVTKAKESADINKRCSSHYRDKAFILGTFSLMATVSWCLLLFDRSSLLVKGIAIIAVLVVFVNDTDNIVIYAYNAKL